MKFTIATQEFNYLINKCLNIIPQKATIPILSNLLLEVSDGMLTITATDLTVGVRCVTAVNEIEPGATTLPAKKLAQLTRELTSMNLEMSTNEEQVTMIVADSSKFSLHGMDQSSYPALPDLVDSVRFTLKQQELKEVLLRTSFTVSREDLRFVLAGIFIRIENGRAVFLSTDGKRLSRSYLAIEGLDPNYSTEFVVPIKAVEEISKNLNEGDGEVTIHLMSDKIAFETTHTTIITKLLIGEYPDVSRIIPDHVECRVPLHREELMTLLRQVALFASDGTSAVRFVFKSGELTLSANAKDVGDGKVSMSINYQGEPLEIAFSPNFFLDVLRHSKSEIIIIGLSDPFTPGVLTDQSNPYFVIAEVNPLFVLMPMRLVEE